MKKLLEIWAAILSLHLYAGGGWSADQTFPDEMSAAKLHSMFANPQKVTIEGVDVLKCRYVFPCGNSAAAREVYFAPAKEPGNFKLLGNRDAAMLACAAIARELEAHKGTK